MGSRVSHLVCLTLYNLDAHDYWMAHQPPSCWVVEIIIWNFYFILISSCVLHLYPLQHTNLCFSSAFIFSISTAQTRCDTCYYYIIRKTIKQNPRKISILFKGFSFTLFSVYFSSYLIASADQHLCVLKINLPKLTSG